MTNLHSKNLEIFYNENTDLLTDNYPGLNLKYLKDVFVQFMELGRKPSDFYRKLNEGTPLEYLAQKKYFYDSWVYVDHRVLIPRSETEILVEDSINYLKNKTGDLKLCEIGIGSGAIFLNISTHLENKQNWTVTDISEDAIAVSKWNQYLFKNKIKNATYNYIKTDRLLGIEEKFDFIVSNPPYIKENADKEGIHHQVLKFEPKTALFLGDNIYNSWFCVLFTQVYKALKEGGSFYMEGHEDHLEDLKELAQTLNFKHAEIKKDYTQRDRFLHLTK